MSEQEQVNEAAETQTVEAVETQEAAPKKKRKILNRRNFLIGSAVITGGVAFGAYTLTKPRANPLLDELAEGETAFTPYMKIDKDGVVAITGRAEMGQGANSVLVAMLADELDVAYEDIRVEHGPASSAYYVGSAMRSLVDKPNHLRDENTVQEEYGLRWIAKILGFQITGGSATTDDGYFVMRRTGAAAREALVKAAAKQWKTSAASLKTENGHVLNPKTGDKLAYTQLAEAAAQIKLSKEPKLKPESQHKYIGKSMPRNDMVPKVTGTATFGMDIELPDMVYAAVRENPYRWRPIKSLDGSAALKKRGVKKVVQLEQGYAVIADNSWRAMQALDDVVVEWDTNVEYPRDMDAVYADLANAMETTEPNVEGNNAGDIEAALASADKVTKAEYRASYLAHIQMEPLNATALWNSDDSIEIWTGTQSPSPALGAVSKVTGVAKDKIKINTVFLGGGFGRRGEVDYMQTAALVARELKGTPVKVLYSREDDFARDTYRPAALARLEGTVENGKVTAIKGAASTLSVIGNWGGRIGLPLGGPDNSIIEGMAHQPYAIPNYQVKGYMSDSKMPIGAWRSVGASQNSFFFESFLDELAHEHGLDPLAMRLDLAAPYKPVAKLLEKVGEMSNWNSPLPAGKARGVALCSSFFSFVAEVVEISQTPDGIKVDKVYIAADPGKVIDRNNFEAQMTGGALFGLSQAMGAVTVADGRVEQSNFHDYPIPRFTQSPEFEVAILENHVGVGGAGEPGTPPFMPALGNAIFALTGKRLRAMPFNEFVDFA